MITVTAKEMREIELETILAMMGTEVWFTRLEIEKFTVDVFKVNAWGDLAGTNMARRLKWLEQRGLIEKKATRIWNGMHYITEYKYKLMRGE